MSSDKYYISFRITNDSNIVLVWNMNSVYESIEYFKIY